MGRDVELESGLQLVIFIFFWEEYSILFRIMQQDVEVVIEYKEELIVGKCF